MVLIKHLLDHWFASDIKETVIIGFGVWKLDNGGVDWYNLLTDVMGDSFTSCKNGTPTDFCNGRLPEDRLPTIDDEV